MKRYFLSPTVPNVNGEHHYILLPDGKYAVVLIDEHTQADPSWAALPALLDQAALPAADCTCLGVASTASMYAAALRLAAIHPRFKP